MADLLIFDTGPLSHLARENWLGVLKSVVRPRIAVIPDVVDDEIRRGAASDHRLRAVLDAPWIERRELAAPHEIEAFTRFAAELVSGDRNVGEAGVLALAECTGGTAVLDDSVARRAASASGIRLTGTIGLLCEAVRSGHLTVSLVSDVLEDLAAGDYRLPRFGPRGFAGWAEEQGLFDVARDE